VFLLLFYFTAADSGVVKRSISNHKNTFPIATVCRRSCLLGERHVFHFLLREAAHKVQERPMGEFGTKVLEIFRLDSVMVNTLELKSTRGRVKTGRSVREANESKKRGGQRIKGQDRQVRNTHEYKAGGLDTKTHKTIWQRTREEN